MLEREISSRISEFFYLRNVLERIVQINTVVTHEELKKWQTESLFQV